MLRIIATTFQEFLFLLILMSKYKPFQTHICYLLLAFFHRSVSELYHKNNPCVPFRQSLISSIAEKQTFIKDVVTKAEELNPHEQLALYGLYLVIDQKRASAKSIFEMNRLSKN